MQPLELKQWSQNILSAIIAGSLAVGGTLTVAGAVVNNGASTFNAPTTFNAAQTGGVETATTSLNTPTLNAATANTSSTNVSVALASSGSSTFAGISAGTVTSTKLSAASSLIFASNAGNSGSIARTTPTSTFSFTSGTCIAVVSPTGTTGYLVWNGGGPLTVSTASCQ